MLAAALLCAGSGAAAEAPKTPTFTKDVAPIFQAKCETCQREQSQPKARVTGAADR